jgi:hypothetical protein
VDEYPIGSLLLAPLSYNNITEYLQGTIIDCSLSVITIAWIHKEDLWYVKYPICKYRTFIQDCLKRTEECQAIV